MSYEGTVNELIYSEELFLLIAADFDKEKISIWNMTCEDCPNSTYLENCSACNSEFYNYFNSCVTNCPDKYIVSSDETKENYCVIYCK